MSGRSSLYDRLGISKGADQDEIRRAYKKMVLKVHPDKGGDPEEFKSIQKAYEVLSDDQRRAFYDATGQEDEGGGGGGPGAGFPGGGMPFPFPFDLGGLFGMGGMFGGGGMPGGPPMRTQAKQQKGPPKVHEMPISMSDFYHGKTILLQFERQKFCETCKGEGAEVFESCKACNGSGHMEHRIQIGPGMISVSHGACRACEGTGKKVSKVCGACDGQKFRKEKKTLNVDIQPGMLPGEAIDFPGECSDEHGYLQAGDVRIILQDADDGRRFTRGGGITGTTQEDMVVSTTISLKDSLLGCQERMEGHPGYSQGLLVEIPVGIQNKERICIEGYGFPKRHGGGKGNLYVFVDVRATDSEKEILKQSSDVLRGIFTGDGFKTS